MDTKIAAVHLEPVGRVQKGIKQDTGGNLRHNQGGKDEYCPVLKIETDNEFQCTTYLYKQVDYVL